MLKTMTIAALLYMIPFTFVSVYAEESADSFMTLSEYNERYANDARKDSEEFLSLHEYNATYNNNREFLSLDEYNSTYSHSKTVSSTKQQSKPIMIDNGLSQAGTLTLQYQTDILGGRPQFLYDRCYPELQPYLTLEYSSVHFSGDRITVYFTFSDGDVMEHALISFDVN